MEILKLTPADAGLVTSLFNDYRVFYKQAPDMALAEQYITARLRNNESVIYVAMAGDDGTRVPAGFTQLYPRLSSVRAAKNWLLNDLYVDARFRKQGIGEALIKTAMEFAAGTGATYVALETAVDNLTAQRLYESLGFVKQAPGTGFLAYQVNV